MRLISSIIKTTVLVAAIAALFSSCATSKEGCWKGAEPKFRYNSTKMRA